MLLDSLNKRVKFLNAVIEKLQLKGIRAIHGRAEDYAKQQEYREQFDLCVSRAVANLATLSEYCLPYVKKDGVFLPYKSGEIDEEVVQAKKAVTILGGTLREVIKFQLPGSEIGRSFVKIEKVKPTSKKISEKSRNFRQRNRWGFARQLKNTKKDGMRNKNFLIRPSLSFKENSYGIL